MSAPKRTERLTRSEFLRREREREENQARERAIRDREGEKALARSILGPPPGAPPGVGRDGNFIFWSSPAPVDGTGRPRSWAESVLRAARHEFALVGDWRAVNGTVGYQCPVCMQTRQRIFAQGELPGVTLVDATVCPGTPEATAGATPPVAANPWPLDGVSPTVPMDGAVAMHVFSLVRSNPSDLLGLYQCGGCGGTRERPMRGRSYVERGRCPGPAKDGETVVTTNQTNRVDYWTASGPTVTVTNVPATPTNAALQQEVDLLRGALREKEALIAEQRTQRDQLRGRIASLERVRTVAQRVVEALALTGTIHATGAGRQALLDLAGLDEMRIVRDRLRRAGMDPERDPIAPLPLRPRRRSLDEGVS